MEELTTSSFGMFCFVLFCRDVIVGLEGKPWRKAWKEIELEA
jgi:hypothetical protein